MSIFFLAAVQVPCKSAHFVGCFPDVGSKNTKGYKCQLMHLHMDGNVSVLKQCYISFVGYCLQVEKCITKINKMWKYKVLDSKEIEILI